MAENQKQPSINELLEAALKSRGKEHLLATIDPLPLPIPALPNAQPVQLEPARPSNTVNLSPNLSSWGIGRGEGPRLENGPLTIMSRRNPFEPDDLGETPNYPDRNVLRKIYNTRVFGLPLDKFFDGIIWGAGGNIITNTGATLLVGGVEIPASAAFPMAVAYVGASGLVRESVKEYQKQKATGDLEIGTRYERSNLKKSLKRVGNASKAKLILAADVGAIMALVGTIVSTVTTEAARPYFVNPTTAIESPAPTPTQTPIPTVTPTPGEPDFIEIRNGRRYLIVPTETPSNTTKR